jgi:hypothetical protein
MSGLRHGGGPTRRYHVKVSGPVRRIRLTALLLVLTGACLASCAKSVTQPVYRDANMDFGAIQTVGVMPFQNLTRDSLAADRVRDVFMNQLLSTGAVYVIPVGEVARAVSRLEMQTPAVPSPDDAVKIASALKANAIITGAVQEYGEVRSGSSSANVISVTVQMLEGQTGRIVWTASSTKGGIDLADRLFGGGGRPMNDVTREAVDDVIKKLFEE